MERDFIVGKLDKGTNSNTFELLVIKTQYMDPDPDMDMDLDLDPH
jgi:hypothetical protein